MLTDILKKCGVNVSYTKKVDIKNGHAIIQVSSDGENSIFLYPGSNELVSKEFIDYVLEKFSEGDILLLQNEISNVDYIIERAYQRNMCIILNPSPFNEKINQINFNMLSYIILNEVEIKAITGCNNYEDGINALRKKYPFLKIMLTLGTKGCIYTDADQELHQNAFKVDVVDTTAAGDTFTGYFIAGISNGIGYSEVLKFASAASAIAVSRKGAAPSIPEKNEVVDVVKNLKEIEK